MGNHWRCLEESGQWRETVGRTLIVLFFNTFGLELRNFFTQLSRTLFEHQIKDWWAPIFFLPIHLKFFCEKEVNNNKSMIAKNNCTLFRTTHRHIRLNFYNPSKIYWLLPNKSTAVSLKKYFLGSDFLPVVRRFKPRTARLDSMNSTSVLCRLPQRLLVYLQLSKNLEMKTGQSFGCSVELKHFRELFWFPFRRNFLTPNFS